MRRPRNLSEALVPTDIGRSASRGPIERRLAAILDLDVKGYSLLMSGDDEDTHQRIGQGLERVIRHIRKSNGRVFSFSGDGLMAEFPSAVLAVKCALRVQADAAQHNAHLPAARRIDYRIGINAGEVVIQAGRTGGAAVNIAARLEEIAEPGGICVSGLVFEQVRKAVSAEFRCMGERRLKNIPGPVTAYSVSQASSGDVNGQPPGDPAPRWLPTPITCPRSRCCRSRT